MRSGPCLPVSSWHAPASLGRRSLWPAWSDRQWEQWLSSPGVQPWLARVDGKVAGMVELELQPGGDVGIVVFGLVPEFVGKGFGGHLLTVGTRLAWEAERRVWLLTSSRDYPHAKPNYERRGFRAFRTEQRRRQIPG